MSSPSSCVRCSAPLAAESDVGLCPVCLAADDTSRSGGTSKSPAAAHAHPTASFRPAAADAPTRTREPSAAAPDRAPAGTATEPDDRVVRPEAPTGYELLERLGGGGMGDVFLARDLTADRVVAVKFLRSAHNPVLADRFLTEVRALARLDHPNIVRVLAHDFYRATPFFAMEYAAGGTLADRVKEQGPLDPADAARLVVTVARAVAAAHAERILHRDLKPSNVLLAADGTPKVSDFGLAKRTDADDGLTTLSGPIGTPGFMPPEQVSRRRFGEVGEPADVYGLGATLYYLLTGRPPFVSSESREEVTVRVVSVAPPRVRAIRPEVPLALEAVCLKCLEKQAADRYPTAAALADDLEKFLAGDTPTAPPLTRWRRARRWAAARRVRIATAAVTFVALAAGLTAALMPPGDPLAGTHRRLRDGKPATLVGATGTPAYAEWRVSPSQFGPDPDAPPGRPGAATFHQDLPCLLELMPIPTVKRYRLTAQLRHVGGDIVEGRVGVFVGLATHAAGGKQMHTMFAARFSDYAPPGKMAPLDIGPAMFTQGGEHAGTADWISNKTLRFSANQSLPGRWRKVAVEVTEDRLTVLWAEDSEKEPTEVYSITRERADRTYANLGQSMNRYAPGTPDPAWPPDGALGILCYRATVSVKNVTIEPIP